MENQKKQYKISLSKTKCLLISLLIFVVIIAAKLYIDYPMPVIPIFILLILGLPIVFTLVLLILSPKNRKVPLLITFILVASFIGFWYVFYPRLVYKKDFDKYCEKFAENKYNCDWSYDDDWDKESEIQDHIEKYCISLGLDYDVSCPPPWSCAKNQASCGFK